MHQRTLMQVPLFDYVTDERTNFKLKLILKSFSVPRPLASLCMTSFRILIGLTVCSHFHIIWRDIQVCAAVQATFNALIEIIIYQSYLRYLSTAYYFCSPLYIKLYLDVVFKRIYKIHQILHYNVARHNRNILFLLRLNWRYGYW